MFQLKVLLLIILVSVAFTAGAKEKIVGINVTTTGELAVNETHLVAYVDSILKGSSAEGRLQRYDIIRSINGRRVPRVIFHESDTDEEFAMKASEFLRSVIQKIKSAPEKFPIVIGRDEEDITFLLEKREL